MQYTNKQRAQFVLMFIEEGRNYAAFKARIKRETKKANPKIPEVKSVKKWLQDFQTTGSVQNRQGKNQPKRIRTKENIEKVRKHFKAHPHDSVRRCGLGLSKSTVHRILKEDLRMRPYKIQTIQTLRSANHVAR